MKKENLNYTKGEVYNECKRVLSSLNCKILNSDFSSGQIEAKKSGNWFSYGNQINIEVRANGLEKAELYISSDSVWVQIFDWGTNDEIENKIVELVLESLQ